MIINLENEKPTSVMIDESLKFIGNNYTAYL